VTSRERIVLTLDRRGNVVEPIAVETREGTYTIGSVPYERRPKAGKK
jgi:hypothetical protein